MKKIITFCSLYILLCLSFITATNFHYKNKNVNALCEEFNKIIDIQKNKLAFTTLVKPDLQNFKKPEVEKPKTDTIKIAKRSTKNQVKLSRGGNPSLKNNTSKVELLDWWKEARYLFSINTVAKVTDVYTQKSFMVIRTMGSNHADTEALTSKDTEIIKSIWNGFSWDRRPIIIEINGRRLAASMSAMPHAGIDSAPAFEMVGNRSQGYGRGQNLDVIKHNGMDGHFDIHFLNSTRHMDGKKDPNHQQSVLKASKVK